MLLPRDHVRVEKIIITTSYYGLNGKLQDAAAENPRSILASLSLSLTGAK